VVSSSGMEFCCISSLSVLWWIRCVPSGGPPLMPMPRNCRLQSNCFCIASISPWYICNRQILEDFVVAFFADHIRVSTKRYDSKVSWWGNPLADIYADWVLAHVFSSIPRETGVDKLVVTTCHKVAMSSYRIVPSWHFLTTLTGFFPAYFLSCKANVTVEHAKMRHGPHCSQV